MIIFGYIFIQSGGKRFLAIGHDFDLKYTQNELFENIFIK